MPRISRLTVLPRPTYPRRWFRPGFTAGEVRHLLRSPRDDARGLAVRRVVARPQEWLPSAPHFLACPQRYHAHLPRLVFWDMSGDSLAALGRRLDGWLAGGPFPAHGVQRAFDTACRRIAGRLDAAPHGYGLRRAAPIEEVPCPP